MILQTRICKYNGLTATCSGECDTCPIFLYYTQHPLGVMPKWLHNEQRREELKQAISRYFEGGKHIPIEWIEEYNELVGDKK